MFFENLNSSAVKSIEINDNIVDIVFNSSDKVYQYNIIEEHYESFVNTIQGIIINEDSIGSYINRAIKANVIVELNTTTTD